MKYKSEELVVNLLKRHTPFSLMPAKGPVDDAENAEGEDGDVS